MWTDPAVQDKKSSAAESQGESAGEAAPLCSIDTLKQSALIKTGGWPGIGPFKGDGNEYVDAGQNRLKLESSRDKITSAELRLNNQNKNTAMFNLEMSADFLLESLGAKEARISDFNGQLEKSRSQLLQSTEAAPLNLSAGSYLVNMHPEQDKNAADRYAFIIKVSSKDASSDMLKRSSASSNTSTSGGSGSDTGTVDRTPSRTTSTSTSTTASTDTSENGWETTPTKSGAETHATGSTARMTSTTSASSVNFGIETPKANSGQPSKIATSTLPSTVRTGAGSTSATSGASANQSTSTIKTSTSTANPPDNGSSGEGSTLKDTFKELISSWQKLKKLAVRQKDTSQLSEVLTGRALVRQSDAIKWLQANKKYYDMNPKSVVVDRYVETVKGSKYAVYAQVKESSKYMDEPTGQVIKDSDESYNVNYTIEKSGDKWLISDSAIIPQPNKNKPR